MTVIMDTKITDINLIAESLNRLVKLALDTGEAASIEDALRLFAGYRLAVTVGKDVGRSATQQAALLTIVNTGRRSLLGGVEVSGITGLPLLVPLHPYKTLEEVVVGLGGKVVSSSPPDVPLIVVGDTAAESENPFAIRTTFDGWTGGIVPVRGGASRLAEKNEFVPSGVLAGALAVAETFQHLRGSQPVAGRRHVGLSLWKPEVDWRTTAAIGPRINRLPSSVWIIGLGNLGQAFLWIIGMLPYADPSKLSLALQDFDTLAESNDSTSLLTHPALVGMRKTRAMAYWAENRGFETTIIERRFSSDFRVGSDDPNIALCGVDNALARSALEDVGFARVIEAGLGVGTKDFLGFRTHLFPGSRRAHDIWQAGENSKETRIDLPAYESLAAGGADRCGLTQLASRTVGAPFVGAIAAAAVVGELLRLVNGAHSYELLDGHLSNLDHRTVVAGQKLHPINPGATDALDLTEKATQQYQS